MQPMNSPVVEETLKLAARHGLTLADKLSFNEMGLDFRVAFAKDKQGQKWVLRIPRRPDLLSKIEHEARILSFVKNQIRVQVPDWQVCTAELIAYPLLTDPIALTYDAQTYAVTWHMDQHSDNYIESLAELLVPLHASPTPAAMAAGVGYSSPDTVRARFKADVETVKKEAGMSAELESQLRKWLDDDTMWPNFSVLVHGDLYAGHVTVDSNSRITGVIDWSEAEISDPAIDFAGHLAAFGEESLVKLVATYSDAGGRTWPKMIEQIKARHQASPVKYALFALISKSDEHLAAAKAQLGVPV